MRSRKVAALVAVVGTVLLWAAGAGPAAADPARVNPGGIGSPGMGGSAAANTSVLVELNPAHHVVFLTNSRIDLGGFAVDGAATTRGGAGVPTAVLVRGRDNAVWYRESADEGKTWGGWLSLGGSVTTRPAVATAGGTTVVAVVGADHRMYERVRTASGWSPGWRAVNATFTGTLAVARTAGGFAVYGRGGDGRLWTATRGAAGTWSAFRTVPIRSGLLLADPAADPVGGALYVRGADQACWTFDPANPQRGWRSLGGRFEAGFGAVTSGTVTAVIGRGLNHRLYEQNSALGNAWFLFDIL